jgi:hypothetical protein
MVTYSELRGDRRRFLALTGLTVPEFESLVVAFARSSERRSPPDRTAAGRPRQRCVGGARTAVLHEPAQKLLSLLVSLKTYPLQGVLAELFGLSQPQVNHWLKRLWPVLREALDDLGALPERAGQAFAGARPSPRLLSDGTERRRQRPKNPEKQAARSSGRKEVPCDKDVVVAAVGSKRVADLSGSHAGRVADKSIAGREGIPYPPGTVLYKESGL